MKQSQKDRVLDLLREGRTLTVRGIFNELLINSPTKVLSDLRRDGHDIEDVTVKSQGAEYKAYRL